MARSTFPDIHALRTELSKVRYRQLVFERSLCVPLRQRGELIGMLIARRIASLSFHSGADQAARNLRRSGCDRD